MARTRKRKRGYGGYLAGTVGGSMIGGELTKNISAHKVHKLRQVAKKIIPHSGRMDYLRRSARSAIFPNLGGTMPTIPSTSRRLALSGRTLSRAGKVAGGLAGAAIIYGARKLAKRRKKKKQ